MMFSTVCLSFFFSDSRVSSRGVTIRETSTIDYKTQNACVIMKTCPCNIQRIFSVLKIENFLWKIFNIFLIFAQNTDCENMIEPPRLPTIYVLKNKNHSQESSSGTCTGVNQYLL